jgi:hypothetical protein
LETERNRYTGIPREEISVGKVHNPYFGVEMSGSSHERAHAHEVLESEVFPRFIGVDRCSGNECGAGKGVIEIEVLPSRT